MPLKIIIIIIIILLLLLLLLLLSLLLLLLLLLLINNYKIGVPLLGLAKSIHYTICRIDTEMLSQVCMGIGTLYTFDFKCLLDV